MSTSAVDDPFVTELKATDRVSERYYRLDALDRNAAEMLKKYCTTNSRSNVTATRLANRSTVQSFLTSAPLAMADFLSLYACLFLTSAVVDRLFGLANMQAENQTAFFVSLVILPIANLAGLYPGLGLGSVVEFRQLARALFAAVLVFAGIGWFCFPKLWVFYVIVAMAAFSIGLPMIMSTRFVVRQIVKRFSWWGAPTLIVAEPQRGQELARRMQREIDQGFRPVGLLVDSSHCWALNHSPDASKVPVYDIRSADEVAVKLGATWVIVSPCANRAMAPILDKSLAAIPNRILLSSSQTDMSIWDQMFSIGSSAGIRFGGAHPSSVELAAKRVLDVFLTSIALVVGFPFLATICLLIRLSSRGPIFYSQGRIGLGGREFRAWKFRSMQQNADQVLEAYLANNPAARWEWNETHKLENDPRVTSIGKFLRASSLDELPQLWNILRGDMSLVGPRPIIDSPTYDASYVHEYAEEFEAYKTVRPGLTGLWQVRCRNAGVYELRIYWDMYYIRNWCVWLDIYLIMRTIKTVLMREGK
ncbi:MAG: exopolysaccharide biosynthesis polyprenyl glycosylphosphotransferase [Planctomycetota bacterium]|nr:exopolysaccharide biosynthesis polyprenyl glycosylphosphotransferase [Planctomycetota bacterium]